jgi:L-iditol 2-dehydrogenase
VRAAILVAPKQIELREVETPTAEPGGIVVRVRAALTDGTDLKAYRRGHPRMPMPTRFGHEFSGDVAAVGKGVSDFKVGDAVMSVHTAPDGVCYWCKEGEEELCETIMATMVLGTYADNIALPKRIVDRNCFPKPANLSYRQAAFLEPLACVMHSLDFLAPMAGTTALVFGAGGFGLLHAQMLRKDGVRVLLAGRRPDRLALARKLGFDDVIDTNAQDVREEVLARTDGHGPDAVIECTGSQAVWEEEAIAVVRRGGVVSFFGGLPADARVIFPASRLHYDQVRLISPFHFSTAAVRRAYEILSEGEIEVEALISQTFALDDIVGAFERLDAGEGIKFAIEP